MLPRSIGQWSSAIQTYEVPRKKNDNQSMRHRIQMVVINSYEDTFTARLIRNIKSFTDSTGYRSPESTIHVGLESSIQRQNPTCHKILEYSRLQ